MIYDIQLSAKHLDLIGAALGQLPYQDVHEIINILKRQAHDQNKAAAKAEVQTDTVEIEN